MWAPNVNTEPDGHANIWALEMDWASFVGASVGFRAEMEPDVVSLAYILEPESLLILFMWCVVMMVNRSVVWISK